jgi:hypothetical protein
VVDLFEVHQQEHTRPPGGWGKRGV